MLCQCTNLFLDFFGITLHVNRVSGAAVLVVPNALVHQIHSHIHVVFCICMCDTSTCCTYFFKRKKQYLVKCRLMHFLRYRKCTSYHFNNLLLFASMWIIFIIQDFSQRMYNNLCLFLHLYFGKDKRVIVQFIHALVLSFWEG